VYSTIGGKPIGSQQGVNRSQWDIYIYIYIYIYIEDAYGGTSPPPQQYADAACHPCTSFCKEAPAQLEIVSAEKWTWCRGGSRRGKPKQLHQAEFTAEFVASVQRKQDGKQTKRKDNEEKTCAKKRMWSSGSQGFSVFFG